MPRDDAKKNEEKKEGPVTDSLLLAITKKVIIPLLIAGTVTGIGWIAKNINSGIADIRVISTNLSNTTTDLEKLSSRYEDINERYHKLENMLTEVKVRLEVAKLENMEASLSLAESVETLRNYTTKIPLSKNHKNLKDLPPKPTSEGPFRDYSDRIIEQRKLIETLKPAE